MKLTFKIFKANEESRIYEMIKKSQFQENDFIIVGEDEDFYYVLQLTSKGIQLFCGLPLDEQSMMVPKDDLIISGSRFDYDTVEINIPEKYLNAELVSSIVQLNL